MLLPKEKRDRQKSLCEIILELSKKVLAEDEYTAYLDHLNVLYTNDFKHQYSDFFPTILNVLDNNNDYNIEYLSNNLDALNTYLDELASKGNKTYENVYLPFTKLCDHLDLQIRQTNYYERMLEKSSGERQELLNAKQELQNAITELGTANNKIGEATQRADSMQTQLISILSIFAAIIITFSGSFTFLGSSVSAISVAKYEESVIAAAIICGMFLFNTIFLLMYFVSKLTGRNIYAGCITENCTGCTEKCKGFKKITKRMPYILCFNIAAIIGIIIDITVWYLDIQGVIP